MRGEGVLERSGCESLRKSDLSRITRSEVNVNGRHLRKRVVAQQEPHPTRPGFLDQGRLPLVVGGGSELPSILHAGQRSIEDHAVGVSFFIKKAE